MTGFVYFIKNQLSHVKIGISKDVESRIKQLETAQSGKLELVGLIESNRYKEVEKIIHKRFYKRRVFREWFVIDQDEIKELQLEFSLHANWLHPERYRGDYGLFKQILHTKDAIYKLIADSEFWEDGKMPAVELMDVEGINLCVEYLTNAKTTNNTLALGVELMKAAMKYLSFFAHWNLNHNYIEVNLLEKVEALKGYMEVVDHPVNFDFESARHYYYTSDIKAWIGGLNQ